jgi:pyruvate carboxylase subunit B
MPGLVVRLEVEPGQTVAPGGGVLVLEAMKMENELRSPAGGRVRAVLVRAGQAVEKGQTLVEFEAPATAS